jgi:hypothetical protein
MSTLKQPNSYRFLGMGNGEWGMGSLYFYKYKSHQEKMNWESRKKWDQDKFYGRCNLIKNYE